MALIECHNLCLGYAGKELLHDLNFEINSGEYLCIIGENGSGKSTLIRTILGLQEPISGQVLTGDGLNRNEIGYLPQQTVVQKDFPATVWEIVLSGCQGQCGLRPFYTQQEKQLASDNIKKVGIEHLTKRCYRELSGGQQQRVLLARALCAAKKILLLDEPVSGLDPQATVEMYQYIENLNKADIAIIMVTHDLEQALKFASHILYIGNKTFWGTKSEYLANQENV